MPAYRTPGVYFEWLDPPRASAPLRTDIAGFVGIAERGPLHKPCFVESWQQFISTFGAHIPPGYLAYAVEGFFANGGSACYAVRIADPDRASVASLTLTQANGNPLLNLSASNAGAWANAMQVAAIPAASDRFTLVLHTSDGLREVWPNLSWQSRDASYAVNVLNDPVAGSRLVRASDAAVSGAAAGARLKLGNGTGQMSGGADGLATLKPEHFSGAGANSWGLATLEDIDSVAIVAMPDLMMTPHGGPRAVRTTRQACKEHLNRVISGAELLAPTPANPGGERSVEYPPTLDDDDILALQREMVAHCERLRDRVAILDAAPTNLTYESVLQLRDQFDSSFAALYYPWLLVSDPLQLDGALRPVPPSGHIAGTYARGDRTLGVHKPPANTMIELAQDLTDSLDDSAHAELNERGVNAIRAYPGRGIRAMGARTLSSDPTWRFINVRRLLAMIEESIAEQTEWTVFEPNNSSLWLDLERSTRGFLNDLWQRGMLDGDAAEQAFNVTCDSTVNAPSESDPARTTCLIGLQLPRPAEFVVVRLGKTDRGTELIESKGVGYA